MPRLNKKEILIFSLAVLLRLLVFFLLLWQSGRVEHFSFPQVGSDSLSYLEAADGILETGRFVDPETKVPNSYEMPGYPLFLAAIKLFTQSPLIISLLQGILSGLSAVLLLRIGREISERVGLLAAFLFAIDPVGIFYSNFIITEPLFIFFMLLAFYYSSFFSGFFLGLSTLVRPVGQIFLPAVLVYAFLTRESFKKFFLSAFFTVVGFLIFTAPWLIRNYVLFDRAELSAVASWQAAYAHAPLFYAYKNNISEKEAVKMFVERVREKSPYGIEGTLSNAPYLWAVAGEYIGQDIPGFIKFHIAKTIPFFLSDGLREIANRAKFLEGDLPNVGNLLLGGNIKGLIGALWENKTAFALFALGFSFWLLVNLFMALGILFSFWRDICTKALMWAFALSVIAMAVVAGGAVSHPRYRLSISPFMFLLAAFGFLEFVAFLKIRWFNKGIQTV